MVQKDILLNQGGVFEKYKKNECIFFEGDMPAFYFQIFEGSVRIVNVNEDGREFIQDIFKKDESFGEPALFIDASYPATAIANEPTTLIKIRKRNFLRIINEHPNVHFSFTRLLAKRLYWKTAIIKEIVAENPEHRLTSYLRILKKNSGIVNKEKYKVELSRQQIANMTGLRVETVIRTIKKLESLGIVTIEKGKVYVL
ncbi:MAG TPA: Crp/Fnr family transcriptional regulator [Chitinophagaceae bacterium]|jgi:CRP-like cAMP-binding protein